MLIIKNLFVTTQGKEILKGVSLTVKPGEIHALMGPNGAGKTSLAMALMGHPNYSIKYQVSSIKYEINGNDMLKLKPEERAREGLFVAFQSPIEVTGVSVLAFLRTAYKALHPQDNIPLAEFKKQVIKALKTVGLDESFMGRYLNDGFSGGEKKRMEMVQLMILKPKFAVLDEIDSGLDVDSLKIVARTISEAVVKNKMGIILITHYSRILHFVKPHAVHILMEGKIKASDGMRLVKKIEKEGYAAV